MDSSRTGERVAGACLQTGQITCHDAAGRPIGCAGSGQDGAYHAGRPWPQPRFEPDDELVRDRLTGLTWTREAGLSEFPLTWVEALEFVAGLNRAGKFGHHDWRLPNRRELRSLIDHQAARPALPADHPFKDVFQGWYWTSTTAVISPRHAWYVDVGGGRMFYGGKDQSFMVWPVRGACELPGTGQLGCYDDAGREVRCADSGQDADRRAGWSWPRPRFRHRDGAVLDRLTGLCWYAGADLTDAAVDWADALTAVGSLNRHSQRHWRLPNINELESLVDCSRHTPALADGHPFRSVRDTYWSSTTSLYEPDWAWALYLDKGAVGVGQKRQGRFFVWPVLGP